MGEFIEFGQFFLFRKIIFKKNKSLNTNSYGNGIYIIKYSFNINCPIFNE